MVLESTIVCFDNSEYQRNGDYYPTRLIAQKDAINLICLSKTRSNPENVVGLLTLSNSVEVLTTLTSDIRRVSAKVQDIKPQGQINLITGIRIAQMVLKNRQEKNHKMRLVVFVGSPLDVLENDLAVLAKRLKKEKVNADIISFGAYEKNTELLKTFINILNGKDGTNSHLADIPRGSVLADALLSSPIIQGEDGLNAVGLTASGYEFGVDPNQDPDLVLALRLSMEEEQNRLIRTAEAENEAQAAGSSNQEARVEKSSPNANQSQNVQQSDIMPDFSQMTDEEQIAYVLSMSQNDDPPPQPQAQSSEKKKQTKEKKPKKGKKKDNEQPPSQSDDNDDTQNISENNLSGPSSPQRKPRRSQRIRTINLDNYKRKRSRSPSNSSRKKKRK